jgi:uncharacterized membrane protein
MSSTPSSRISFLLTGAALLAFFGLVAFFLGPNLIEKHDKNAAWYLLHIAGGSLVLLLGPFQFIPALRNRFRNYHRAAGYTFFAGSAMTVIGYIGLPKVELFLTSQLVALILWVVFLLLAIRAIRAGKILTHQHNMARTFVLACYFLTARVFDRYLELLEPLASDKGIRLAHSDWLAWLTPLLLVELYFTFKWQETLGNKASRGAA